jgi:adenylate cyclase
MKFGGDVLFIAGDGTIVASSIGDFFNTKVNSPEFEKILRYENNILQNIWQQSLTDTDRTLNLNQDGFLAHFAPFFTGEIPWFVITIVPEEKFLGPLNKQMITTITLGIILAIFFALMAALFFGHISKQLKAIADELDLIGKFKFSNTIFSKTPSFVKEVTMMNIATDKMKVGLNSFSKYVPVNLVRELLKSGQPAILNAKKANMSVLFTDIVNFTTLSEKIPPEELIEILGTYLESMSQIIQQNLGEVDKYIGDSIMAIFGAPLPLEDHAMQACLAALEMQKKLNDLNKKWAFENKPHLEHKIGINTGSMVVGNIGSTNRFEYTVIGDNVNLASRIEGLNKVYKTKILVGEETALLTKDRLLLRPLDFVAVKGKEKAHLIFELIAIKDKNSDLIENIIENSFKALEAYKNRDFVKAKILFECCYKKLELQDFASKAMMDKCDFYIKEPPDENWTCATVMYRK